MFDFYFTWIVLPVFFITIYLYLCKNYDYWRKRGIKGPRALPFLGTDWIRFLTPGPIYERDWTRTYGRNYGIFASRSPILRVGDPDCIKQILVKDFHIFPNRRSKPIDHQLLSKMLVQAESDDWRRMRTILSPAFTSGRMRQMYPIIRQCIDDFMHHLAPFAKSSQDIDLKQMYGKLTMDVIARCAFATNIDAYSASYDENVFVSQAKLFFEFPLLRMIPEILFPASVQRLLGITWRTDDSVPTFFSQITRRLIAERKQNGGQNNGRKYVDFVQILVDSEANDDESVAAERDIRLDTSLENEEINVLNDKSKVIPGTNNNKKLTDEEIMAQGCLFISAGYETTAWTLTYCTYELALNPDVQRRLYDEVSAAAVDPQTGDIPYDVLTQLPYLDAVLSETLRLYPPITRLPRCCLQNDYQLANSGIQLYAGQRVEIPVYGIQRSAEFFPNPDKFDPDRFMPENRHKIIPYTYLPFGAGPRSCIAMRFGLMEAKLALIHILKRYQFVRSAQTAIPLQYNILTFFCTAKQVVVGIQMR